MRPAKSSFVAVLAAAWSVACGAESPTVPEAPELSLGANGFQVATLQLRAGEGSTSQLHGPLLVRVGMRHPPNPCLNPNLMSVLPSDALTFCGIVRNPGSETLASGELVVAAGDPDGPLTVRFGLTHPPNPCTTLLLQGVLVVPSVATSLGPLSIRATFFTADGQSVTGRSTTSGVPVISLADGGNVLGAGQDAASPGTEVNPGPFAACTVAVVEVGT